MKRYAVTVLVDWDDERFGEPEPGDLWIRAERTLFKAQVHEMFPGAEDVTWSVSHCEVPATSLVGGSTYSEGARS